MSKHDLSTLPHVQALVDLLSQGSNLPINILSVHELRGLTATNLGLDPIGDNEVSCEDDLGSICKYYYELITEFRGLSREELDIALDGNHIPDVNEDHIPEPIRKLAKTNRQSTSSDDFSARLNLQLTEQMIWSVSTGNSVPLHDLFSLVPEWKWLELIWLRANLDEIETQLNTQKPYAKLNVIGVDAWSYFYFPLDSPIDKQFYLVVGPIYSYVPEKTQDGFDAKLADIIISDFSYFYWKYCQNGDGHRFAQEDMGRFFNLRTPISDAAVVNRALLVKQVIDTTASVSISNSVADSFSDLFSDRRIVERLTRTLFGATRLVASGLVSASAHLDSDKVESQENTISTSFAVCLKDYETDGLVAQFSVRGDTLFSNSASSSSAILNLTMLRSNFPSQSDGPVFSTNGHDFSPTSKLPWISSSLERWWETGMARKRAYEQTRVRLTGDWLNYQYLIDSIPPSAIDQQNRTSHEGFNFKPLCEMVRETLRADSCLLYQYRGHDQSLPLKVLGFSTNQNSWSSDEIKKVADFMEMIGGQMHESSTRGKDVSVVMRCLDTKRTEFYTSFPETPEVTETSESCGLSWPDAVAKPGRLVATPILIEGRIWGILEIATIQHDAIRRSARHLLNAFGSMLGSYLFNRTLIYSLRDMGTETRRDTTPAKDAAKIIGDKLAKTVCEISLARGAIIFLVPEDDDDGIYQVVGTAGPKYFDSDPYGVTVDVHSSADHDLLLSTLWRDHQESGARSVMAKVDLENSDRTVKGRPNFRVLGEQYAKNSSRASVIKKLIKDDIKQVNAYVFDISDFSTIPRLGLNNRIEHRAPPTGFVLLYYRDLVTRPHWSGLNELVANRLGQTFHELVIHRRMRIMRGKLMRHELRHGVVALSAMGTRIQEDLRMARSLVKTINDEKSRLGNGTQKALEHLSGLISNLPSESSNWITLLEELETQASAVERYDDLGLEEFASALYLRNSIDSSGEIAKFTQISVAIQSTLLQYQKKLRNRRLYLRFGTVSKNAYVRIRPEYMSLILRNIFDNWVKYASAGTDVEIVLDPELDSTLSGSYTLTFINHIDKVPEASDIKSWTRFEARGADALSSDVPGDGVGLFWIDYIIRHLLGQQLQVSSRRVKHHAAEGIFSVELIFSKAWITSRPDFYGN